MAITIQPPQPGDLITSHFMRLLIEQLTAFDQRLSALEIVTPGAGGNLAILNLSATDLNIGDELRIFGVNFGLPAENVVTFSGSSPVTQFKSGSNDTLLILDIPTLSFLPDSQAFDVAVSDPRGFDKRPLTIHKAQPTLPSGTLQIGIDQFPPGNINVPATGFQNYVFQFHVEARTEMDENYNVTPTFPPGWNAAIVTDATGNTVRPQITGGPTPPPWRIPIAKRAAGQVSTIVPVFVRLSIPSTAVPTAGGSVGLNVSSVQNPNFLVATPFSVSFPLNAPAPNPQTLTFGIASVTGSDAQSVSDTVFALPTRTARPLDTVVVAVHGLSNAQYQINLSWLNDNSNGWTASLGGVPTTTGWPFMQSPAQAPLQGPGDAQISVNIIGATGALPATLIIAVQKLPVVTPITTATDYGILNQIIRTTTP